MKSKFKFLDPYEKKDKDIFFGREKEIELLFETTFETNLILVYGHSGTGKTSLIQCGLANRLRESDWFDIFVRRGDNINRSLHKEIRKKATTPIAAGASVPAGIQSLYLDFLKPIYLIFDQFEELFILGSAEERQEFFKTTAQLLQAPGGSDFKTVCKIIFVMREEYIARLYDFERVVPGLFDNRIRVERLPPAKVAEVVRGSAAAFGIGLKEPEKTLPGIIASNTDKKGVIELPYLQVYLDRLYREAAAAAASTDGESEEVDIEFTPALVEKIGKISDVMADFLDEQTEEVQQKLQGKYRGTPEEFVYQVLNQFVSVEGTGLPLEKEALYSLFPVKEEIIDNCLTGLEKSRILRLAGDEKSYEIVHDALARRIDDKRSAEEKTLLRVEKLVKDRFVAYEETSVYLAKGELNYIEPYEKKLAAKLEAAEVNFIAESRKKVEKKSRYIIFSTTAIIIILLLFADFALWQWRKSVKKANEAEANRLATIAEAKVREDPTLALRIAEQAWRLDKNKTITDTIYKIYRENIFYKIAAKHEDVVGRTAFSPDGKTILTGSWDGTARLWRVPMPLEEFLEKGLLEPLTPAQKKLYGIKD